MKLTIVYDEDDVSLNVAARVVSKYRLNPSIRAIVIDNETYFVKHTKGLETYTISTASRIAELLNG